MISAPVRSDNLRIHDLYTVVTSEGSFDPTNRAFKMVSDRF